MASVMLLNSENVKENESTVIAYLIEYAEVLFGLRVENLSVTLWPAAFNAIVERFPGIQLHDIQNSYRYAEIEKRQYTTLTRDELIEPVANYWQKKASVLLEIEIIRQKEEKEIQAINKEIEFKENAKKKYISCLETGVWTGDEFEANAIARNFKDILTQDVKNNLVEKAKNEYVKRTKEVEDNNFGIVPTWQKIYARLFIEECLKRKYKYIQE